MATRTQIPHLRRDLVQRRHLIDSVERSVSDAKLTLLAAPAGYGKTTLLSQWANSTDRRVGWVTLDTDCEDPAQLFRYLIASWASFRPDILESPAGLLAGSMTPDIQGLTTVFLNAAAESEPFAFVLDECETLQNHDAIEVFTKLIDHAPSSLRFLIASRSTPPLPLARFQSRGELQMIGIPDLAFSNQDVCHFAERTSGSAVTCDDFVRLATVFEGWPAGIRLALSSNHPIHEIADACESHGGLRSVEAYFREEILPALPTHIRSFLLDTGMLGTLCADLANQLTGRTDSQELLASIEAEGLFLQAVGPAGSWFRYHAIFAEFLIREKLNCDPDGFADLHCRAARWFFEHKMPENAFEHAVSGHDSWLAGDICDNFAVIKLESGELRTVARWLDEVPPAWFDQNPAFRLASAAYLIYTGSFEESLRLIDLTETQIRSREIPDRTIQLGKIATVRCAIACFQNDLRLAESFADQALSDLSPRESFYIASVHHALGDTYARNGIWDKAAAAYLSALAIDHQPSFKIRSAHIYGALADLELRQGKLSTAGNYWALALQTINAAETWGKLPLPVIGWVQVRQAELCYERNQLQRARELAEQGVKLGELGQDTRTLIAGHLVLARCALVANDLHEAQERLAKVAPLIAESQFVDWVDRYSRQQLELAVARNDRSAITVWLGEHSAKDPGQVPSDSEIYRLALVRAHIELGTENHLDTARSLLSHLLAQANTLGRLAIQIEALCLQAMLLNSLGDELGAVVSTARALRIAEPEGYIRTFADLGERLFNLISGVKDRGVLPPYLEAVLEAFEMTNNNGETLTALAEPLSSREAEVLQLLAVGLTNREVGERLYISHETVKKHTSSIYSKLSVTNRTQAVAVATSHGLLDE